MTRTTTPTEEDDKASRTGTSRHASPKTCSHCQKQHNGVCWTKKPSRAPGWWQRRQDEKKAKRHRATHFHPFMRLPAELRINVYEYYFQPATVTCKCYQPDECKDHINAHSSEERTRRSYNCRCYCCLYSAAFLHANKQVYKEALPVLEATYQVDLSVASIEFEKRAHRWRFGIGHSGNWGVPNGEDLAKELEGLVEMPETIKLLNIHLDTWHLDEDTQELPALLDQLKYLHSLADRMTFVVDVHATRERAQRSSGWSVILRESGDSTSEKQTKVKAMREQLVRGLEAEFAREGETLKLRMHCDA